jgi:hypothetical protein
VRAAKQQNCAKNSDDGNPNVPSVHVEYRLADLGGLGGSLGIPQLLIHAVTGKVDDREARCPLIGFLVMLAHATDYFLVFLSGQVSNFSPIFFSDILVNFYRSRIKSVA